MMTEAEWLVAAEPEPMFDALGGVGSDRKFRLFVAVVWRAMADAFASYPINADRLLAQAEVAEVWADEGRCPPTDRVQGGSNWRPPLTTPAQGARRVVWIAFNLPLLEDRERAHTIPFPALIRDLFGNPFRPVAVDPVWRTSTVVSLAEGVYAERAFDRLPILADALQDTGCESPDVLDHCRGPGPHARGCWVVDLLLGKS
jgi:hypothetical protein